MNIEKVKHEVLNNNFAIEYDNKNLEKLRKVLKYIFPDDTDLTNGIEKFYYKSSYDACEWTCWHEFNGNSIPLSKITFDKEDIWEDLENSGLDKPFKLVTTLNDVIELRKKFPNNMEFADKFDELISKIR